MWKDWPLKLSMPSMRGRVGAESGPMAVIRKRARVPAAVLQRHVPARASSSCQCAAVDAAAELDVAAQVELVGDVVQVAQRLRLRRRNARTSSIRPAAPGEKE